MVSSTLRAMGPSLSRDQQRVMAPVRGTRPKVGRRPVTPQRMEGADDAASGFRADGEGYEAGCGGCARAGAAAGGAFFEEPGVHGLAAEPDVVEGESAEGEFCDENGSGLVEAGGDGGVGFGDSGADGSAP